MTDAPISAERLALRNEIANEIDAIYGMPNNHSLSFQAADAVLSRLSPPGLREALEAMFEAATPFTMLADNVGNPTAEGWTPPVELWKPDLRALNEAYQVARSRLSALPESGGAANFETLKRARRLAALVISSATEEELSTHVEVGYEFDGREAELLNLASAVHSALKWVDGGIVSVPSPDAQALNEIARKESRGERNTMIDLIVDGPSPESAALRTRAKEKTDE